jgi:hypothetical protein
MPKMRESFREHHRLSPEEAKGIWDSCTFALDTNVLLNIYRYAEPTREDLFRVLRHLGDRVWVPFQVAKEFYALRLEVIREQRSKYEQLSRSVSGVLAALSDGKFKKSGFLKIAELEQLLRPAITEATAFIEAQSAGHPDLIREDSYVEELVEVIGAAVGDEPSAEQRVKETAEAQLRIERTQPPGYRDAKKPVPDRYGDVFIWFELIRLAQTTKRPIIFVTDDDKEDWWQIENGEKLGPRPELRGEMRKMAGVEFGIYNPARLMELVGSELEISVPKSSIDDARKIAEELQARNVTTPLVDGLSELNTIRESTSRHRTESGHNLVRLAEDAVALWLSAIYPEAVVGRVSHGHFDFMMTEGGSRVGVDVKLVRDAGFARAFANRIREIGYRAFYETSLGRLNSYLLVIVCLDIDVAIAVAERIEKLDTSQPLPSMSLGFLDDDRDYVELINKWTSS